MPTDPNPPVNEGSTAEAILAAQKAAALANNAASNEATNHALGNYGDVGTDPSQPGEYTDDPFDMDTGIDQIGEVPDFGGDVDLNEVGNGLLGPTGKTEGPHTTVDENGNVQIAGEAVTREVQDEELVSHQMDKLLSSDSKYMQDARRQGLEQSAAMGGLGGTAGIGASMQAAVRAGLPIAQADAQAFQQAASENMQALNQYAQLNLQRATQLEGQVLDAKTQLRSAGIQANAQLAQARLQSATQRDISMLDNSTQLRAKEMEGQIQSRLAAYQHQYNTLLEDQRAYNELLKGQMSGEYTLANTELSAQWEANMKESYNRMAREATANQLITQAWDGYMNRLADLNNTDMDGAARTNAINSIKDGLRAQGQLIAGLYPDMAFDGFGGV